MVGFVSVIYRNRPDLVGRLRFVAGLNYAESRMHLHGIPGELGIRNLFTSYIFF